ncbi:50S ribosomal protein L22 [Candidatus Sumerlaeota bacterium]|nr:50S ribosomal protein L22 [Candidatus Sumerlaeota bacterium]
MSRARRAASPKLGEKVSTARARYLRVGPRKIRDVADLIRGLTLDRAQQTLATLHRPSGVPIIRRLLSSALSNANHDDRTYKAEELIIGEIFVDGGPTSGRFRPRAMGRAAVIRKRTSHVTVHLFERPTQKEVG